MEVGIKAAKSELSELIKRAAAGERVVITSHGKPVVRLVPEPEKRKKTVRGYGFLKGKLTLPPGWDSPEVDEEIANLFEAAREIKGQQLP